MMDLLKNLALRDLLLKVFSFALAVLIWVTVHMGLTNQLSLAPTKERVFTHLPVVILSSAEDVRSLRVEPKEVDVTVRGDAKSLQALQAKDIHPLLDLTGIEAARELRKRIEISTPAGVTFVKVEPEEVQVIFPPKS